MTVFTSAKILCDFFLLLILSLSLLRSSQGFEIKENVISWVESMFLYHDYPMMAMGFEKLGFENAIDPSIVSTDIESDASASASSLIFENLHKQNNEHNLNHIYVKFSIYRPTNRMEKKSFPLYLTSSRFHFATMHDDYPDFAYKAVLRSNYTSIDAFSFRSEYEALSHFSTSMKNIFEHIDRSDQISTTAKNHKIVKYIKDLKVAGHMAKIAVGLIFCQRGLDKSKYDFVDRFVNFAIGESDESSAIIDDFTYRIFNEAEKLEAAVLFNRYPIEIFHNYLRDTLIPLIKREHYSTSNMRRLGYPICKGEVVGRFNGYDYTNNEGEDSFSIQVDKNQEDFIYLDSQRWFSNANFYSYEAKTKMNYFSKLKSSESYVMTGCKDETRRNLDTFKGLDIFSPYFEIKFLNNEPDISCETKSSDKTSTTGVCKNRGLNKYFAVASICPLHNLQADFVDNNDLESDILSSYSNFENVYPRRCQNFISFRLNGSYSHDGTSELVLVADRADMEPYLYTVLWSMVIADSDVHKLLPLDVDVDLEKYHFDNTFSDLYKYGLSYGDSNKYRLGSEQEFLSSFISPPSSADASTVSVKLLQLGLGAGSLHAFLLSAFPTMYIDSVEANEDVFEAARSLKFNGFCDVMTLEDRCSSTGKSGRTRAVSIAKHFNISDASIIANVVKKCRSRVILADYLAYLSFLVSSARESYNYVFVNLGLIDFFEYEEDLLNKKKKFCSSTECAHVRSVYDVLINKRGLGIWRVKTLGDYTKTLQASIADVFGVKNMIILKSNTEDLIIVAGKNLYFNPNSNIIFNALDFQRKSHPCLDPRERTAKAKGIFTSLGLHEHADLYSYTLDCRPPYNGVTAELIE